MKLLINVKGGAFEISTDVLKKYLKSKGIETYVYYTELKDNKLIYKKEVNYKGVLRKYFLNLKDYGDIYEPKNQKESDDFQKNDVLVNYSALRIDKDFIEFVENHLKKEELETYFSKLEIIEIKDGLNYVILENEGKDKVIVSEQPIIDFDTKQVISAEAK